MEVCNWSKTLRLSMDWPAVLYFDEVRAFQPCTSTVNKLGLVQFKDTKVFLLNALQHYQAGL